jgi:hypothetical protein
VLGLVERYAAEDAATMETVMTAAEEQRTDPAERLVIFTRTFEDMADEALTEQPQCLFVSFIYETELSDVGIEDLVADSIRHWRDSALARSDRRQARTRRRGPPRTSGDGPRGARPPLVHDVRGAFLLAQAVDDPTSMRGQIAHLRHYLELLFGPDAEIRT